MTSFGNAFRCIILLLGLFAAAPSFAQATRTWVSGVGDDANPCSRTAPCKTFAGAISKTAAAGVIDVLDPGGFGAVTITKSITLENVGEISAILVTGTNGIIVNDSTGSAIVVLRGLSLDGGPPGSNSLAGISFIKGSQLIVERSDIGNFTGGNPNGFGINFMPTSAATLVVRDSTIHDNGVAGASNGGILVSPGAGGSATVSFDNVRLVNNAGFGLQVLGPTKLTMHESLISGNAGNGVSAVGGSATASLLIDRATISNNAPRV